MPESNSPIPTTDSIAPTSPWRQGSYINKAIKIDPRINTGGICEGLVYEFGRIAKKYEEKAFQEIKNIMMQAIPDTLKNDLAIIDLEKLTKERFWFLLI